MVFDEATTSVRRSFQLNHCTWTAVARCRGYGSGAQSTGWPVSQTRSSDSSLSTSSGLAM